MCGAHHGSLPSTPQEALSELMAGNERFVNEKSINPRSNIDRIEETAPHQAPFAAVVGCSDSRVPVELLARLTGSMMLSAIILMYRWTGFWDISILLKRLKKETCLSRRPITM